MSELLRRLVDCDVREVKDKPRTLRFVISTEQVARDGDIIRAKGWDVAAYRKNPVVLWSHNPFELPIGRGSNITKHHGKDVPNPRVEMDVTFASEEDGNPFADQVYRLYKSKFLRAVSVGFMPKEINRKLSDEQRETLGLGEYGREITKAELLELSGVSVPADTGAVLASADAGELREACVAMRGFSTGEVRDSWDEILRAMDGASSSGGDEVPETASETITAEVVVEADDGELEETDTTSETVSVEVLMENIGALREAIDTANEQLSCLLVDSEARHEDILSRLPGETRSEELAGPQGEEPPEAAPAGEEPDEMEALADDLERAVQRHRS